MFFSKKKNDPKFDVSVRNTVVNHHQKNCSKFDKIYIQMIIKSIKKHPKSNVFDRFEKQREKKKPTLRAKTFFSENSIHTKINFSLDGGRG